MDIRMFIVFLAELLVSAENLSLDIEYLKDSLFIETVHIFKDEFPACVPHNVFGDRTLLRFDTKLDNACNRTVYLNEPPTLSYDVNNAKSGTIALLCLRDTQCDIGEPVHYRCTPPALSENCSSILSYHAKCQWIDITDIHDLILQMTFELEGEQYTFTTDITTLPTSTPRLQRILSAIIPLLLSNLIVIFLPYGLHREKSTKKEKPKKV